MAGTLYRPEAAGPRPAVLLLHGSTPSGRRLPLYRWLGLMLSRRGYVVLCIDQRGFGESDPISKLTEPSDLDFPSDVQAALSHLRALEGVDGDRLVLFGHSFGGSVAAAAAARFDLPCSVILLGPGRRFGDRVGRELDRFRLRYTQYMKVPEPISRDLFLQTIGLLHLEMHLDYFKSPHHPPLLLIDGGVEAAADKEFLAKIFQDIAEPKAMATIAGSDHYANVSGIGNLVILDAGVARPLEERILSWLEDRNHGKRRGEDPGGPVP